MISLTLKTVRADDDAQAWSEMGTGREKSQLRPPNPHNAL